MPIYEFYCETCNTIFNFFSRSINTRKIPNCPACKDKPLARQMSTFAVTGKAQEEGGMDDLPFDERKMEKAMQMLTQEGEYLGEDDPRQAAQLMRKMTDMTGLQLGSGMEEALHRMEQGEDPETVEAEMGDLLDGEEPFLIPEKTGKSSKSARPAPRRDDTLYEL